MPETVLTNEQLAEQVDTSNEWIVSRTGIRERRISGSSTTTADLAALAAERALQAAGMPADALDLILCATTSGDYLWPATACVVQQRIRAVRAAAYDLAAACSGFCYGLANAAAFIESGAMRNILLIGADTLSKHVNWNDRSTCVLFGDGAGAALISAVPKSEGILASVLGANGDKLQAVWLPDGGSRSPITAQILAESSFGLQMNGREVYRFCVEVAPQAILEALCEVGLKTSDIDLLVMHQANLRILQAMAERLDIPMDKVFVNLDRYGNTSAASVPLALTEAHQQGKLKPGSIVVTAGFGAGLTWAANVMRWAGESNG